MLTDIRYNQPTYYWAPNTSLSSLIYRQASYPFPGDDFVIGDLYHTHPARTNPPGNVQELASSRKMQTGDQVTLTRRPAGAKP